MIIEGLKGATVISSGICKHPYISTFRLPYGSWYSMCGSCCETWHDKNDVIGERFKDSKIVY